MGHRYSVIPVGRGKDRKYRVLRDGVGVAFVKTLRTASIIASGMIGEDEYRRVVLGEGGAGGEV